MKLYDFDDILDSLDALYKILEYFGFDRNVQEEGIFRKYGSRGRSKNFSSYISMVHVLISMRNHTGIMNGLLFYRPILISCKSLSPLQAVTQHL